ncbi:hypothetical protein RJ641_028285, partial [Dillenia turbinata]
RIVSFLPLKQAVKTSIPSTVWRSFWSPSRINLDFVLDELLSHESTEEFMRSYDSPELCKFYEDFAKSQRKHCSEVNDDALFLSAAKGPEKELHLDFHEQQHQLTSGFNLKMEEIASCRNFGNNSRFSFLKTLHLTSVTHLAENLVAFCSQIVGGVIFERLEFQFYKLKEFWWVDSVMNKSKQGSIACFMKITPHLEKLLINKKASMWLNSEKASFFLLSAD